MKPIVLSGLLLSIPLLALGQPAAVLSFEVASVKLHTFPRGTFAFGPRSGVVAADIRISGNRVTIGITTFSRLVMAAYDVKDFQIAGVPESLLGRDQFYDIAAKVEGEDTPVLEQVRPMLRTLLADRFQLQLHRETKELSVYNLVVGKNGPKLKDSTGPRPAQPAANNGPVIRFNLLDKSMADLVRVVAPNVDRPVLDKTGLTGRYDFSLEYTLGNPDGPTNDDAYGSIFAAVQELGLKLAPAKEQGEVLVIDHAERPSAN